MNERINSQQSNNFFFQLDCNFFCILFYTKWFCISLLWLWSSSSLLYLITTPNYLYTNTLSEEQAGSRTDRQTDRPYSFISSSLMFPSFLLCLALFFCFSCYWYGRQRITSMTHAHTYIFHKNTLEEKKYCTILFSWW